MAAGAIQAGSGAEHGTGPIGRPRMRGNLTQLGLHPLRPDAQEYSPQHPNLTGASPYAHRSLTLDNFVIYGVHREG